MEFNSAYLYSMQHKRMITDELYNIGISSFERTHNRVEKESILLRLISIYPKKSELYYRMACLFNGDTRSLTWHKICFSIDPCHKENILKAIQILYSQGLGVGVFDYTETPIFKDLIEDPIFLGIYARCNLQQLYYNNGVTYLLKLIEYYCKKPAIKLEEKVAKWSNYHDLGYVYCVMGDIDSSLRYTKKAVDLANKFDLDMWQRLLSFSNVLCYSDFKYSDKAIMFQEYLKINDYLPPKPLFSHRPKKNSQKIKIGYVSSDFTYHAVANFIIPILENHNLKKFDIVLYANQEEFSTDIFVKLGIPHKIIKNNTDEQVAKMIFNDRVDILIDLNGHTVGNRLGVFRFQPAPIQITYLGYPNTTGMKTIHYRITDKISDAEHIEQYYTERLLRLPSCFLLYKPFHQTHPMKTKTSGGKIILGAINKENKNSQYTLDTWSEILRECPNANILIKLETFDNIEERKRFYMDRLKTSSDRIIILPKQQNSEYIELFSRIDILLDTFPYSGTTTTCNALFNSVPVVTLYHKDYHAHNVSASILTHSGLDKLVASSGEQYICIVKELVENPEKIDEYKRTIHGKFREGMMDGPRFMKGYEDTLINILVNYNHHMDS